jgi:hypothetical protein
MWATFIRLATVLERNPFDPVIDHLQRACGRRPRIEGLSLDRQEKRITFFRILPSKLVTVIADSSFFGFHSIPNVMRLTMANKPCVIYDLARGTVTTVYNVADWRALLYQAGPHVRQQVEAHMTPDERLVLFP